MATLVSLYGVALPPRFDMGGNIYECSCTQQKRRDPHRVVPRARGRDITVAKQNKMFKLLKSVPWSPLADAMHAGARACARMRTPRRRAGACAPRLPAAALPALPKTLAARRAVGQTVSASRSPSVRRAGVGAPAPAC